MKRISRILLAALMLATACLATVQSHEPAKDYDEFDLIRLCRRIKGRIMDHTANHGHNHRIWSRALHQWRDLYVYLPPGYSPRERYPLVMFFHPFAMDERTFMRLVPAVDDAICAGKLPPLIIAAPDGSIDGKGCLLKPGSFFINSNAGPYEDFVCQDVWDFVCKRYPIRSEREAHVLAGISMGGFAAYNIGIRHRDAFGIIIGMHPPLNLRWCDVDGNPRAKFDPRRWGWRTGYDDPHEVLANFAGAVRIRMGPVVGPVFGVGDDALLNIAANNPIELACKTGLRNGELSMFVGYAGRDEFNIDAQVESFLYWAKFKGIGMAVAFEPDGHHDGHTAMKMLPTVFRWLRPQLEPYAPGRACVDGCN
jgi:S-formylglutathione hydrolase FrmB